jgi:hypothetical protein
MNATSHPTNPNSPQQEEVVPTITLFNPLKDDFLYFWFDDDMKGHPLTIPSLEIAVFPKAQGDFMAKHLTDRIDQQRGGQESIDIRRAKIMEEIIK